MGTYCNVVLVSVVLLYPANTPGCGHCGENHTWLRPLGSGSSGPGCGSGSSGLSCCYVGSGVVTAFTTFRCCLAL
jgi:hypothetical protein